MEKIPSKWPKLTSWISHANIKKINFEPKVLKEYKKEPLILIKGKNLPKRTLNSEQLFSKCREIKLNCSIDIQRAMPEINEGNKII